MLTKLLRRLQGVFTLEELTQRSDQHIERIINSPDDTSYDITFRQLDENLEWFEAWRESHVEILKRVADSSTRQEQVIKLRKETISLIESSITRVRSLATNCQEMI